MTLEQYWIILIKQWKLVVTCFIIIGLGAYIGSKLMKPIYQSSVLVQVAIQSGNNQGQYDNLLASEQLIQTESQLAVSDPVLREVASHYPGLTADQLSKQVTSSAKLNTQLFEIDVQDTSPVGASMLANDIANTLIKQQLQVTLQESSRAQQRIQQDLVSTRQQKDALASQIATLQAQGRQQARVAVLQSQLDDLQQHYNQWQMTLAQLQLTEAQNEDFLRVAQVAQPALKPVQPNSLLNTGIGLGAGLLLGILLAIVVERLDTRVRTPEEIAQLLEWPALATVWYATSAREEVVHPQGRDANVEAYRILRTNIGFAVVGNPLRSLMVTSAQVGDGKSVVASNLAIFMAKAGKKTLLIDADLRRPTLHEKFGLPAQAMGFSNAILAFSEQATHPAYGSPSDKSGAYRHVESPFISDHLLPAPQAGSLTGRFFDETAWKGASIDGHDGRPPRHTVPQTASPPPPLREQRHLPKKPTPESQAGSPPQKAASAALIGKTPLERFVHAVDIPNLYVMPSGPLPPNPPELLDAEAMQHLLAAAANGGVEVVIFDGPPLLGLSDASILASKVDGALAVVDITRANKGNLKQMRALLAQTGVRVIGYVVNKQRRGRKDAVSTYYYGTEAQ